MKLVSNDKVFNPLGGYHVYEAVKEETDVYKSNAYLNESIEPLQSDKSSIPTDERELEEYIHRHFLPMVNEYMQIQENQDYVYDIYYQKNINPDALYVRLSINI